MPNKLSDATIQALIDKQTARYAAAHEDLADSPAPPPDVLETIYKTYETCEAEWLERWSTSLHCNTSGVGLRAKTYPLSIIFDPKHSKTAGIRLTSGTVSHPFRKVPLGVLLQHAPILRHMEELFIEMESSKQSRLSGLAAENKLEESKPKIVAKPVLETVGDPEKEAINERAGSRVSPPEPVVEGVLQPAGPARAEPVTQKGSGAAKRRTKSKNNTEGVL